MIPIDITTITIGTLVITEMVLAYRIWKLERMMNRTMIHFIDAKNFLGSIKERLDATVELIKKSELKGKVTTSFGTFEGSVNLDAPKELRETAEGFWKEIDEITKGGAP